MLETESGNYVETTSSILRYLVRTATNQTLYNENSPNIGCVDQNLDLLNLELFRNLAVLQNSERQTEKVSKVDLGNAKQNTMSTLKSVNMNLDNCDLELNLSDFVLFVFLGSVLNKDVKKSLKGLKNIKTRWETLSKVEDFEKLITSLKVDKETKMGVITEVKQELRKVQALKINYSTLEKVERKRRR